MDNLNKFYKITIEDKDIGCYNMKPFDFSELNDTTTLADGSTVTNSMKNRAINTFRNISRNNGNATKCCDPENIISNPSEFAIFNDFVSQYPKFRNINENGKIAYIELTTDTSKPSSENWTDMNAITFCRINKALNNNSLIQPTEDVKVFKVNELLGDCPTEACNPDSYQTVEDLFTGVITPSGENSSSRVQDKEIYYGMKNKSLASLVKYIKEFNDVNRLINYQGNKYRLLHLAAEFYDERVMDAVLAMKPELDVKDGFSNTALHVAVKNNNYYAVEKLLDAGASKDIKNKNGMTPIMIALILHSNDDIFNNYTYLTLLHNSGASIYDVDKDKNTMLHIAIIYDIDNIINVVNYLIDNGIETNVKNKYNKTALQLANEKVEKLDMSLNENNISVDKLTKHEAGLLTAQTLIFNSIIRNNPSDYQDYINLEDLSDDVPLLKVINYRCVPIDSSVITSIDGNETKDECIAKGGDYKLLENDSKVRVKFTLDSISNIDNITDDTLYVPKMKGRTEVNSHPLIKKINENAKNSIMVTSTEDSYPGEYISRDIIYTGDNKQATGVTKSITTLNNNIENFKVESINIEGFKVSDDNVTSGYNNAEKYLTKQSRRDILLLILTICLIIIFIIFLWKLTV